MLRANERVDPNIAEQNGSTALMGAAFKGHASVVTVLLADKRVDPSIADQNGFTALICAADKRHGKVNELLLVLNPLIQRIHHK